MLTYKVIRYKSIKNQHKIISQIAYDLFSDPIVRSQFLSFITAYAYPLSKMQSLHHGYGEKDEVKRYKTLINQADGKIQLKDYPPEIRKLLRDTFYDLIDGTNLWNLVYSIPTIPEMMGAYKKDTDFADFEIIVG